MRYETVIGLEVHIELATKTKIFCPCTTEFGGAPNTHVCPVCLGLPGTLPVLNGEVVRLAVRAGLAANCEITRLNRFDRKNYFYPDLPKAYQISQLYLPICRSGFIDIGEKRVRIKEIHMEEDAGKLIHDPCGSSTLVDYNRCGVPLLEIVSEPDMRSAQEAVDYLEKLRELMQFAGVSDCKMQEGALRADVNVSVRQIGSEELGVRTEMKNLNSFKAVARAVRSESERQISLLERGERVVQQTRRWDDAAGKSCAMRSKEDASDYKYFPEPDLPPVLISDADIERARAEMPELPQAKRCRYRELGLKSADIDLLMSSVRISELFDRTFAVCGSARDAAAWINVELPALLRDRGKTAEEIDPEPDAPGRLINMILSGKISRATAKKVFAKIIFERVDPEKYVEEHGLGLLTDDEAIREAARKVTAENEKSVSQYRSGKTQAFQFIMGQCMRELGGKAPADAVSRALHELLDG